MLEKNIYFFGIERNGEKWNNKENFNEFLFFIKKFVILKY